MKKTALCLALAGAAFASAPSYAVSVTNSLDATALANALGGSGITISNAALTYDTVIPAGFFSGGAASVGFDSGVVLTTGTTDCVAGPNTSGGCGGGGYSTSLKFDFVSATGQVFFNYVFASEEYNYYVNSSYNDKFELRLNGVNIAQLPGGAGIVSINNVNCLTNSAYYVNNVSGEGNQPSGCVNQNLDIQYDGLTKVLTASANVVAGALNTFEFFITDAGDSSLDSGVFIKAGSFSGTNPSVPEPLSLGLLGLGLFGVFASRKRK